MVIRVSLGHHCAHKLVCHIVIHKLRRELIGVEILVFPVSAGLSVNRTPHILRVKIVRLGNAVITDHKIDGVEHPILVTRHRTVTIQPLPGVLHQFLVYPELGESIIQITQGQRRHLVGLLVYVV